MAAGSAPTTTARGPAGAAGRPPRSPGRARPDRCRARSRCPASGDRRAAPRGRRSGLPRPARTAGPPRPGVVLERGPRVVVEPAHERRLDPVGDADRVEVGLHGREVLGTRRAQVIRDARRARVERRQRRILRVQETEGVRLEPPPLEVGQPVGGRLVVRPEQADVGGPAGRIADRVDVDLDIGQPRLAVEAGAELDQLRVDRRPGVADRLHVPLPELAEATGLRPVVAEHRVRSGSASPATARCASRAGGRPGRCRPSPPAGAPTSRSPRSAAGGGRAPSRRRR